MAKEKKFRKVSMDHVLSRDYKVDTILRALSRLKIRDIQEYIDSYKATSFEEFDREISKIIEYYTTFGNGILDQYYSEDELGDEFCGYD